MLLNDFYVVQDLEQNGTALACTVRYREDHAIFNGHFPGQPVVPGVCTLQMIRELLQEALGCMVQLQQAGQVKFLRLITPEVRPSVAIQWQEQEGRWTVAASLKADDADLFRLSAAVFIPA